MWETKHGLACHKLYKRWACIKGRCHLESAPSYNRYGALGIELYNEWRNDFKAFYDYVTVLPGYDLSLTIDRIDPNGNYEPGNIRWVNRHIQSANCRTRKSQTNFTGVYRNHKKYLARICVNYKIINIGTYKSIQEAVNARNQYIIDNELHEYNLQKYESTSTEKKNNGSP